MTDCLFASDLHGRVDRYRKLFGAIESVRPAVVFLGGDLLPGLLAGTFGDALEPTEFVNDFLAEELNRLRRTLGAEYPRVLMILGNDDGRSVEPAILEGQERRLWSYIHDRRVRIADFDIYGYNYVPPTPFQLKDWERYDVSRYVDPGCISPEEGQRSVEVATREPRFATIRNDLERLAGRRDMRRAVFLFHTPPHCTKLDRAALDGKKVDHAPVDVHVGSIAVRRFIEERQPWLCLHGHVHESARLTGAWSDRIGRTPLLGAAHDGPELALIRFHLDDPGSASRRLV